MKNYIHKVSNFLLKSEFLMFWFIENLYHSSCHPHTNTGSSAGRAPEQCNEVF